MKNNLSAKTNFGFLSIVLFQILFLIFQTVNNDGLPFNNKNSKSTLNEPRYNSTNIFDLNDKDKLWVEQTMAAMTVYDKCTQIFMPAVFGKSLNQSSKEFKLVKELVKNYGIGGVVISIGDVEETASMLNELQKSSNIPLLTAADFENGIGMRMNASNTFPHNMALGSTNNTEYAYQTGKATAIEALMLGVNFNFAPVADVNNNPENPVINLRSYSEDKNLVTEFCKAYIQGSIDGGVIPTAKHFPGHGNTRIDSHFDMPVINGTQIYLYNNELLPFIKLIENDVPAIMIGHLNVPAFESNKNLPASLSYNIITKLLKEKLGYKGLIITDALDMKAVTNYFSDGDACVQAFKAGNDILLMPQNVKTGINAIYNAVKSKEISIDRLNESVRKILSAKRWLKLDRNNFKRIKKLPKRIRLEENYKLSKTIAEKSIAVIKMDKGLLPLDSTKHTKSFLVDITNRSSMKSTHFSSIFKENFAIYSKATLTSDSKKSDYQIALDIAKDCELIVVASYFYIKNDVNGKALSDIQLNFIDKLLELNKKVIIISFENPYILSLFPNAENYICTFSNTEASQRAALNLLNGSIKSNGRLPITIPDTEFKIGYKWDPNI
jgi:beta-N-acetylhexosaminidase